jgi:gliding motility-associated-like protein
LAWFVNNNWTGVDHTPPVTQGQWQNFNVAWTAPAGTFSAEFCIQVSSGWGIGNDFGFDDVDIRSTVVLSDQVTVNVTPLPAFDLGPDASLCDGQSLTLDPAVPGGTYTWQDGSTAPSFVVNTAGNYTVDVTANGCSASDDIEVNYNPLPVVDLGPDLSLCTGETVVLDVTQSGASYGWSDGSGASTLTVSGPGNYGVTVGLNNCFASDQVDIAYNAIPTVALGPDQAICAGEQATFVATTPGASYLWQDGSTGPTYTSSTSEVVQVDVSVNNCTGSDAASVVVNPLPVFDLGPDVTVCPGTVVNLNATLPGATYLWQDGSTAATFAANTPGTYTVDVTVANCTANDVIVVDHYILPVVDLGADITLCAGNTTTLGVNIPGSTHIWSTGEVSPTISTGTAGTYWVDVNQNGCPVRDSLTVNVTPLPMVDLGADLSVCPGDQALLDATTAGAFYLWSTGAGSPSISVGPGNYIVQVTVDGCPGIDDITVNAFPGASVDLGNDTTLCPGQELLLDATQAGASHIWQDGSSAPTFLANAAGTYSVDLTDANGCEANDAITVQFATPQAIDLGNDTTLCFGSALTLDASVPGGSYTWSTGATTSSIAAATAGNYSVVVQQGNCSTNDAITVQVSALPVVALGNDLTLCPGETLLLDAGNAGSEFLWNTGSTAQTLLVDQPGTFSVTVTNAADCAVTDAITVNYATPGAVNLGPDATLCQGEQVVLDATIAGATYLWSTGATTPSISVGSTGIYSVEVFQGSCSVTDAILVQVNPVPVFDLGNDQVLCAGESTVLDATSAGSTYLWSTGATTPTITVSTTGTYSVTATLNGCTTTDDVVVTVLTPSVLDLGPDIGICAGTAVELDATLPGATYLWSTGETSPTVEVGSNGTYWVTVSQASCSISDTVVVTVNDPGTLDLGPDVTLCDGEAIVLDASLPGASYIWEDGSTQATITVSLAGNYSVTATVDGCSVSDEVAVSVNPIPTIELGDDVSLCPGLSTTLNAATAGATYLWSDGSTASSLVVTVPGNYSVEVNVDGCSASDGLEVIGIVGPVVELGPDTTLCLGQSLVLDVTQESAEYLWEDGSTLPVRTITEAGDYRVEVVRNGCTADGDILVSIFDPSSVDLGPDQRLCPGESATLTCPVTDAQLLWNTGATGATITVSTTGTYWVEATNTGCIARDSVVVTMVPLTPPDLGPDQVLCVGDTAQAEVEVGTATVLWSTGSTGPSIAVTNTGTYGVTLELEGCTASDEVRFTFLPTTFETYLGWDSTLCPGEELLLSAETPFAEYLWSTGSADAAIVVNTVGTYTVQVSTACAVSTGTMMVVEGECAPEVNVPNAFTPNGDGINDVFQVVMSNAPFELVVNIFDRWGELIYTSTDPDAFWDGTYDGTPAQDGVYVYTVRYRSIADAGVVSKQLTGHVTLLR